MGAAQEQTPGTGSEWIESVIRIYRSATVVKGGRRFSFSALVVVGDGRGTVGLGYGKANEVPQAVEKGFKDARKNLVRVRLLHGTVPHAMTGRSGAVHVHIFPACPGTGVKAGGAVRAVLEAAGVRDILSKCHRVNNPKNVAKATMDALRRMRTREDVERLRGVRLSEVTEAGVSSGPQPARG
jgi:small subunit ribosomal protein S5